MNTVVELPLREAELAEATHPPLEWVSRQVLRGRNVHHAGTVVCVRVRMGRWLGKLSTDLSPAFVEGCMARLLKGAKAPPNAPQVQSLMALLRAGEPIALERLLLECLLVMERRLAMERLDFLPIAHAEVRHTATAGEAELVWSSHLSALSIAASRLAVAEFNRLLATEDGVALRSTEDLDAEYASLVERSLRRITPVTVSALLLAAHMRGLPADPRGGPEVQFGQGALQRLGHSTVLEGETMASARLARHKARTARRLAQLGLPSPRQNIVHSVEDAVAAAQKLGFPVVVKPLRGKGGAGVSVGVRDAGEMPAAAERARDAKGSFLVEEMVRGTTYRLLVIAGKFVAALRLDQPRVRGDGQRTMRELIDALNADPMRDVIRLAQVELNAGVLHTLATQGHTLDSIPKAGEEVLLRGSANIGSGATHTDVTELVHPGHVDLAERAAAALGLVNAGVDFVSRDIALPPYAAHSCIVEVNARPGLHTHMFPFRGTARNVGGLVLDAIFPADATGRVPTALVVGRRGSLAMADAIAEELHLREIVCGVATRQRCAIGGARFDEDDLPLHEGVARMWRDPRVQALVVAVDARRAVAGGLVVETADVACVMPRDTADDPQEHAQAVALAAAACRVVMARRGDEGVAAALDGAVKQGLIAPDAIHWLEADTGREAMATAVADLL